jgi:hypothetical protein
VLNSTQQSEQDGAINFMDPGLRRIVVALVIAALGAVPAFSEDPKAAPHAAQSQQEQASVPTGEVIVVLIRSTLMTLNDALQTGNFTVLRDMGSPGFREANSAARLSQLFTDIMRQQIDLSAAAVLPPQLSESPSIDPKSHMLSIKGHFAGDPVRIDFDLLYQPVGGRWRLFGLSVQPVRSGATTPAGAPDSSTGKSKAPAKK